MDFIEEMKNKVLRGEQIDREEALRLSEEPSDRLREAAEGGGGLSRQPGWDSLIGETVAASHAQL